MDWPQIVPYLNYMRGEYCGNGRVWHKLTEWQPYLSRYQMVGLPYFRSHSKFGPFATQPLFDHSKSRPGFQIPIVINRTYGFPGTQVVTHCFNNFVNFSGTGKTDVAVQIISNLYHNFPEQRTLIVTHSNQALNQLFEKIMALVSLLIYSFF